MHTAEDTRGFLDDDADALFWGLQAAGLGIFSCRPGASRVRLSRHCAALLGLSGQTSAPTTQLARLLHADDFAKIRAVATRAAAQRGDREVVELRLRTAAGQHRWLRIGLIARHDACGNVTCWHGSVEPCAAPDARHDIVRPHETPRHVRFASAEGFGAIAPPDVTVPADVPNPLQLATAAAGIGIHDYDVTRNSIRWDARIRDLWGVPADEPVTYDAFVAGLHPDDRERVEAALRASLDPRGDRRVSCEFRVVHRVTRAIRWVHSTGQVAFVGDVPVRLIGTMQDISERKYLYDAVEAAQSRLQLALDASNTGLWSWDPVTDLLQWSPETYRVLGMTIEEPPTGDQFLAMVHPDDRVRVEAAFDTALDEHRLFTSEYRLVRDDGVVVWVADRGQAIRDAKGTVLSVAGTITNITQQRYDEDMFRRGEERLRLALEAARAGAWDWDLRTGDVLWSPETFELYGMPRRTTPLRFAEVEAALDPDDRAQVLQAIDDSLAGRTNQYRTEFRAVLPDGSRRWLAALGQVQRDADGTPRRMYGLSLDISRHKQLEEALQRADRQKDEFLAILAHELRNPLAPIRTVAKILESPCLDESQIAWSREVLQRQVRHLALLLDDLLDVARITQGKLELKRAAVGLHDVLNPAIETVRPLLDERQHRLVLDVPDEDLLLYVDPLRLSQIVSNLLTNAAKYTTAGGCIKLRVQLQDQALVIEVSDNGVGIAAESLPEVFDLFLQLDETRSLSGGGLGIGLALVRGLVQLHGGRIEAASDGLGHGSTFRVTLPWPGEVPAAAAKTGFAAAADTPRLKVLVVDDNRDAADALGMLLGLSGHEVRVAHGGRDALRLAEAFRPDAAVVDIGMPDIDGYEVARTLRANPRTWGLRLIALTGWGQANDKARAIQAGFDEHLTKPVDPDRLEAVLELGQGVDAAIAGR